MTFKKQLLVIYYIIRVTCYKYVFCLAKTTKLWIRNPSYTCGSFLNQMVS